MSEHTIQQLYRELVDLSDRQRTAEAERDEARAAAVQLLLEEVPEERQELYLVQWPWLREVLP